MLDRQAIQSTLTRLQDGTLTPQQATQQLLGLDDKPTTPVDELTQAPASQPTLGEMVDRLGPPDSEIVDAWCHALEQHAQQFQSQTEAALSPIDWRACRLTDEGSLEWPDTKWPDTERPDTSTPLSTTELVDHFRRSVLGDAPVPSSIAVAVDEKKVTRVEPKRDQAWHRRPPVQRIAIASTLIAFAVSGYIVTAMIRSDPNAGADDMTQQNLGNAIKEESPSARPQADLFAPGLIAEAERLGGDRLADEDLEMIESMSQAEFAALESSTQASPTSFSLDAFMPVAIPSVPGETANPASDDRVPPIETDITSMPSDPALVDVSPNMPAVGESDSIDSVLNDDQPEPEETIQPTSIAAAPNTPPEKPTTSSIELPPSDSAESVAIDKLAIDSAKLEFPFDVPIEMVDDRADPPEQTEPSPMTRLIRGARKQIPIALLSTTHTVAPEPVTSIRWQSPPERSASASSLIHGRFRDTVGNVVYLRPGIESDPLEISLDQFDVMPTWDLRYAIPPRDTRISVDFDLPQDLELAWIEPVDPESVRRGRAAAVLTCPDYEGVSLGVRMDVRCTRKLSCRIRYAARLDSSMPWQTVSTPLLQSFNAQMQSQADLIAREADRLSNVYDMAGTMGRRIIRIKQKRNDAFADQVDAILERTVQLETLIAKVESSAQMRINVWVQWPDTAQPLLNMTAANGKEGADDAE